MLIVVTPFAPLDDERYGLFIGGQSDTSNG